MSEAGKTVPAVENAAKILRYLAQRGGADGAAGTARATGLNVSSVFNILKTLANEDLVSFNPEAKTYSIGIGILGLAGPLLGMSPADVIHAAMIEIAHRHKAMVALWQVTDSERIVLQHSTVPDSVVHVNMPKGARLPAFVGAVGRCYAARTGISRDAARHKFESLRWQEAPCFEDYWAEVEDCRTRGYAFDFGNLYRGMSIVAAICCDGQGTPRLGLSSINIMGQVSTEALHEIGESLAGLGRKIETNILAGGTPA